MTISELFIAAGYPVPGLRPISPYFSVPVLLHTASFSPLLKISAFISGLYYATECRYVSHKYLILHRIMACYCYLYKLWSYYRRWIKQINHRTWSIRKKNAVKVKGSCRQVKKRPGRPSQMILSPGALQIQYKACYYRVTQLHPLYPAYTTSCYSKVFTQVISWETNQPNQTKKKRSMMAKIKLMVLVLI